MAIVNYEAVGETARKKLIGRDDITAVNLRYIEQYVDQYDVSPARLNIFYRHIGHFLSKTKDVKKDMSDKAKINKIFATIRKELSPAYYATVVNVTLTFVRWLNDGDKPTGFKDIKNTSKKKSKRKLSPDDMITWEDGKKMASVTTSIQTKALILTQLEGGFRPSEIYDLRIKDIRKDGKFLTATVDGKTGQRTVILFESVPSLSRWLDNHPYKNNKNEYVWVIENQEKVHRKQKSDLTKRPSYNALIKKVKTIASKAKIDKPVDFYNLRHSSAVINKLKGWPVDLIAKNMGHSITEHESTYGRLSVKDNIQRLNKVHGNKKEETNENNPIECPSCQFINEPSETHCEKCRNPLSLEIAMQDKQSNEDRLNEMQNQLNLLHNMLKEKFDVKDTEVKSEKTYKDVEASIKRKIQSK